ncbi:unnamed protein product [Adineta ricciae]|uniref:Uncharacterized protein n=1 Tax=Adineta ricciae TaxID=249248 RepID=A0A815HY88_ADIRI|nr:unnamed protein product [Adineta ricciae]
MPRKNTMRDSVNAVRSRLPHLSDLSREKIELALLYYESNVDETVAAFERDGALEALSGWSDASHSRAHTSAKRINGKPNKPLTLNTTVPNGVLRPSQRVSSIFQTFAEGGTPSPTASTTIIVSSTCSPSSISSSSFLEQSNSFANLDSPTVVVVAAAETLDPPSVSTTIDNTIPEEPTDAQKPVKSQRRKSIKNRNSSTSSITQTHDNGGNSQAVTTATKVSNSTALSSNRKLLVKSVKDLQRQTSTLSNVELLFNSEIKASIKRIDDVFKQIYEILKEREVALYLEMDKAKEQGLNVIHRRQQRGVELRQRIDRCDRLESSEIDSLRHDIKQFVTDRRYDLSEELTSAHRFDYDQSIIDALKHFGTVLTVDRRRSVSAATATPLFEATTPENPVANTISDDKPVANGRTSLLSSTSNEVNPPNHAQEQQPLPQRTHNNNNPRSKRSNGEAIHSPTNRNGPGDSRSNSYSSSQTNGYSQYHDDPYSYQNINHRRLSSTQYSPGNFQRPRPLLNYQNGNYRRTIPKQINARSNMYNNSEPTNTYHHPRPSSQSIVPVQT